MKRREPMPARFEELAEYNARLATGKGPQMLQGTQPQATRLTGDPDDPGYTARMAVLQADFDAYQHERNVRRWGPEIAPHVYLHHSRPPGRWRRWFRRQVRGR